MHDRGAEGLRGDAARPRGRSLLARLARRGSIRRALLIVLTLTLAPLALLAAIQGLTQLERDRHGRAADLAEAAGAAAAAERTLLRNVEGLLGVLAASSDVAGLDAQACARLFRQAVAQLPAYSHFSRVDASGKIVCASNPAAVGDRYDGAPVWRRMQEGRGFTLMGPQFGAYSGRPVITALKPVETARGLEIVAASLDLERLAGRLDTGASGRDGIVALTDGAGRVIAASAASPWTRIALDGPAGAARLLAAPDGRRWVVAHAPIHEGPPPGLSLVLVQAEPRATLAGQNWQFMATYFALPLLALLLASLAIWFAANETVLRWVDALGDVAGQIGQGRFRVRLEAFEDAPAEVRGLAAQFQRMSRALAERDQGLLEALDRQRALALEVHHRVRNNLQIVSSILSIRARGDGGEPRGGPIASAQLRVAALALVHRLLYDEGELTTVLSDQLLHDLCRMLAAHPGLPGLARFDCDAEGMMLGIDAAVPIALWVLEAADWLLVRRGAPDDVLAVTMRFEREGDAARLTLFADAPLPASGRVPAERMLSAIAQQLGARVMLLAEDALASATLSIPVSSLERGSPGR